MVTFEQYFRMGMLILFFGRPVFGCMKPVLNRFLVLMTFIRPSHLKIPGRPKMACVVLSRQAMCGNEAAKRGDACLLFGDISGF